MRRASIAAALLVAGAVTLLLVGAGDDEFEGPSVAFDGRSPTAPVGERVRILVALQRPSLGERIEDEGPLDPLVQHAHVRDIERESRALQSALAAKGVRVRRLVLFARVWSGFAATVDTEDLPEVQTLGVNAQPVRRFYPATTRGQVLQSRKCCNARPDPSRVALAQAPSPTAAPALALLDSGVDLDHPRLRGRMLPGYDAVEGDRDPRPGSVRGRRDEHGTQIAGVLAEELDPAERIVAVRVAGVQRDGETGEVDEVATTDQLMGGLEYAVDPDRDGAADDHVPVALAAVNSPYAGFASTPEGEAVDAARALGTLVVAPAGNEGEPAGRYGTIGSPGAAEGALAVGALAGGGAPAPPAVDVGVATEEGRDRLEGTLLSGGGRALRAGTTSLSGPSQADPRFGGRSAGGTLLDYFSVDARPRAGGRAVVVPREAAGREPALAARAAAAASAGAAALIVCDPDGGLLRPLPRGAGGGMPVIGLTGGDARRALDLVEGTGGLAFVSEPHERTTEGDLAEARASSRGPTYGLRLKPDLAAPGSARAATTGGGEAFVSGTSVAAARVAAAAVKLHRARAGSAPGELASALVGSAEPLGPVTATGAGQASFEDARGAAVVAEPAIVTLPSRPADEAWTASESVTLRNPGDQLADLELRATVEGSSAQVAVAPARVRLEPGARASIRVDVRSDGTPAGLVTGRVTGESAAGSLSLPFAVPVGDPPPPRLGELALSEEEDGSRGVRFAAGAVTSSDGALAVDPLGELVLELVGEDGETVRELTPPGGARNLLPGEYAYTLTDETLDELSPGSYRFEARARGPAGGDPVERRSASFEVR